MGRQRCGGFIACTPLGGPAAAVHNAAMPRPIEALIHQPALAHNIARARQMAPDAQVLAVVKANAYGHGIENEIGRAHV